MCKKYVTLTSLYSESLMNIFDFYFLLLKLSIKVPSSFKMNNNESIILFDFIYFFFTNENSGLNFNNELIEHLWIRQQPLHVFSRIILL